jgi:hypothetical protein
MSKNAQVESDEARLAKKVATRGKDSQGAEQETALRRLKKRLKRVQRKRRAQAIRKKHAAGKKTPAEIKAGS